MSRNIDPRKPFFIAAGAMNLDGTLDTAWEDLESYDTADEAIEWAKEQAEEHGGEYFIYETLE